VAAFDRRCFMSRVTGVVWAAVVAAILSSAAGSPALAADAPAAWLHVKVESRGPDGETVRINTPISLVEAVLKSVDIEDLDNGFAEIDGIRCGDVDVRQILAAFKECEDGDYVTVSGPDENVRVSKEKGLLIVHAEDTHDGRETVDIRIRAEVIEALISGPSDRLDVASALRLLNAEDGDLVTVVDGEETVRIWVDSSNRMDD
jgi:hypothetical protein